MIEILRFNYRYFHAQKTLVFQGTDVP